MYNIKHYDLNIPTTVITLELGAPIELREEWAKRAYNLNHFSYKSNVKAQMSSYHIWAETKVYNKLIDNIQILINHTCKNKPLNKYFKIEEAWSAIYREGEYVISHDHSPCLFSFCYYIKCGKPTTPLVFDQLDWRVDPKEDMLIIFPSNLWHSVPPHKGTDRIMISGNGELVDADQLNSPRHYPKELVNID